MTDTLDAFSHAKEISRETERVCPEGIGGAGEGGSVGDRSTSTFGTDAPDLRDEELGAAWQQRTVATAGP